MSSPDPPSGLAGRAAVFLDRDGVLNRDLNYVHSADRFEPVPGAAEAIAWLNAQGRKVIFVTNQAGIARGYYTEDQLGSFTRWIEEWLHSVVPASRRPTTARTTRPRARAATCSPAAAGSRNRA